ncbi:hypothetical protein JCM10449v2_006996 [Rhodotorula kratochvilovae]
METQLVPARPALSLIHLPPELLTAVLSHASREGRLRNALLRYMRVCKTFYGAPYFLQPKQAEAYFRALGRTASPARLAASTRCLAITYRVSPGQDGDEAPVPAALAARALSLTDGLHYLDVDADDELQLLRSAGTPLGRLRGLTSTAVRWDKLVGMLMGSSKLASLDVMGLYDPYTQKLKGREAEEDDDDAWTTEDEDSADDESETASATDVATPATPGVVPATATFSSENTPSVPPGVGDFTVLAHPPSPDTPPASEGPSPFPHIPLKRIVLTAPKLSDGHLLSLVSSCRDTLEALVLTKATCFSRTALVLTLRLVPNLLELSLDGCTFTEDDEDDPRARFLAAHPALAQRMPQHPVFSSPPRIPSRALAVDPASFPASFALLTPGSATHDAISVPLTGLEQRFPLAALPALCPFLQTLVLASEDLVRDGALVDLVAALPLARLEVGFAHPQIALDEVKETLARARGRLETLVVRSRTGWTRQLLDEVVAHGAVHGTVVFGEVWVPPTRPVAE